MSGRVNADGGRGRPPSRSGRSTGRPGRAARAAGPPCRRPRPPRRRGCRRGDGSASAPGRRRRAGWCAPPLTMSTMRRSGRGPWTRVSAAACAGEVVDAVERHAERERRRLRRGDADVERGGRGPGPAVTATAPTWCHSRPASSSAARIVGTIACTWARAAISGTTPPKRACSSMLEARASPSSTPSRTKPTPVSSHDVSMPITIVTPPSSQPPPT